MRGFSRTLLLVGAMIGAWTGARAEVHADHPACHHAEPAPSHTELRLSPALRDLLRAEMREIAGAMQRMTPAVAAADWAVIAAAARGIRASYILAKRLTPAQSGELERVLPAPFKALDADFHGRAGKLAAAATAHDAELVVFHYARLVEACTSCHAAYARTRLPGFAAPGHRAER